MSEEYPMSLRSLPGDKVRFSHPKAGYPFEQAQAEKHLTIGSIYTIERLRVGSFKSWVSFEEVPNMSFNTVQFSSLEGTK